MEKCQSSTPSMDKASSPVGRALHQEWKDVLLTSWQGLLKKVRNVARLLDELRNEEVLTKGSHSRLIATIPSARQGFSPLWCNAFLAAIPPDRRGFEGLKRSLHKLEETDALHYLFSLWAYEAVCLTPPVSPAKTPQGLPERPYLSLLDVLPSSHPGSDLHVQRHATLCLPIPPALTRDMMDKRNSSPTYGRLSPDLSLNSGREKQAYVAMESKDVKRSSLPRKLQHRKMQRQCTPPGLDYWSLYKLTTHVEKHPSSLSEYQLKGLLARLGLYPMDFFPTRKPLAEVFLSVLEQWKESNLEKVKPSDLLRALQDVPLDELSGIYEKHVSTAEQREKACDVNQDSLSRKERSMSDTSPFLSRRSDTLPFLSQQSQHYARTDVIARELRCSPSPISRFQNSVDSGAFSSSS